MYKLFARRFMALALSVCMIAGMIDLSGFTVRAAEGVTIRDYTIEVVDTDIVYDSKPKEPAIVLKDVSGQELADHSLYKVTYENNTNAGWATVKAANVANEQDYITGDFLIEERGMSNCEIAAIAPQRVLSDTVSVSPVVTVTDTGLGTTLEGKDYSCVYSNNTFATSVNGKGTVTVSGKGNYEGSIIKEFDIEKLDPEKLTFSIDGEIKAYTGNEIKPGLKNVQYNNIDLTQEQYTVSYRNNIAAADKTAEVTVTGKGEYAGLEKTKYFSIRKNLNTDYANGKRITAEIRPQSYTGEAIALNYEDITLNDPEVGPLEGGVDYEITGYNNNVNETTDGKMATVTLTGKGKYVGPKTVEFKIEAARLTEEMIDIQGKENCKYDGSDQYSKLTITVSAKNGKPYTPGTDYTITHDAAIQSGTHWVKVTPQGKLKGDPVTINYTVAKRELNDPRVTVNFTDTPNYIYDGTEKKPGISLTYTKADGTVQTLTAPADYNTQLGYSNNLHASGSSEAEKATVWATAAPNSNFTGESVHKTFHIEPLEMTANNTEITGIDASATYTGDPITFKSLGVKVKGRALSNTDYTTEYANNVAVGSSTASITIRGTGDYKGEFVRYFSITECSLKDRMITIVPITPQQYTGNPIEPKITIKHNTRELVEGTDFDVDYGSNNTAVGTVTVTITGKGNYKDEATTSFSIVRRNITQGGELLVRDAAAGYNYHELTADEIFYKYENKKIEPELTVTYRNREAGIDVTLEKDVDYKISFIRNTEISSAASRAQVIINADQAANGNYAGTKTYDFTIKGDLSDYGTEGAYTEISIPDQIYTSKEIIPANADVKFNKKALTADDYTITCSNNIGTGKALATFEGRGFYFGTTASVEFNIVPLNLTEDDLAENGYVINGVQSNYTYSGFPVIPQVSVVHNGNELTRDFHYDLEDQPEGEDVDNVNVSTDKKAGKLIITGRTTNYIGSHEIKFTIDPYDIQTGEEGGYDNGSKIEVEGLVTDVILDRIEETEGVGKDQYDPDRVVQTGLEVYYTAKGLNGETTNPERRLLELDKEYTVSYENNDTIGTATITIKGKGNFSGEITREFKIRGDLSSDATNLEVKDCMYSPSGEEGIIPEHKVTYTITRSSGVKVPIELVEGEDYVAKYDNNHNATINGTPATIKILPVKEGDTEIGNYTGERSAEFNIEQRDLSAAIESEGRPKDPELAVTGLAEDGYEYTGEKIVPQLQVSCKGTELSWIFEGESGSDTYDYVVSAVNNTNVYEYSDGSNGPKERLYPTVTVTARQDENGEYKGNYKGSFQMRFQINPRLISAETVDNEIQPITGMETEMDYTGVPVTFPLISDDPADAGKNAIRVTWSKEGPDGVIRSQLVEGQDYVIEYKDNIKIGEAKVVVKAVNESNYAGEYEKPFKIMASIEVVDQENPPLKYMGLKFDENVPYGIVDVYPEMIFEDYSGVLCGETNEPKILVEGEDFEIVTIENQGDTADVSKNNKNVASKDDEDESKRPLVVIRGKDCYRGVIKRYYNIIPKDLSTDQGDITVEFTGSMNSEEYENAYIYTGAPIEPQIKVYNHGQIMVPDVDYVVAEYVNNINVSTAENRAGVVIEAVQGGNYQGRKTFYFDIVKRTISGMEVTITGEPQVFNRQEKCPPVEVSYMDGANRVVLSENEYEVAYANNINAATENSGEEAPVVIITGKGDYEGEIRKNFTILPESLEIVEGQEDDFEIGAEEAIYTGKPVTTTIYVTASDGTPLNEGEDYELGEYTDNVNIGTATIAITGKGNYTGTRQVPFRIIPAEGKIQVGIIPDQIYNGLEIMPKPEVSFKVENVEGVDDMEFSLTEGEDYELSYADNIDAGTASVTITGTGNFPGTATANFTILPKSICNDVSGDDGIASDMVLGEIEDQIYTGRGLTPDVDLSFHMNQSGEEEADQKLILNRDYTLSYTANITVGTAGVTVTGINNYTGSIQTKFRILGTMNLATIGSIPVQEYTGSPLTPKPQISFVGTELTEGVDYTLEYADNIERGTATITITGIGWYTGTRTITFDIARELSEETLVRGIAAAYTYNGAAIMPAVRVEEDGNVLTIGTDYTVSYSNNVNVGTATISITGINKYIGSRSVSFKIIPKNISRANVSAIAVQTYTGKDIKPDVRVENEGKVLTNGTDYKISYADNKNPGTGRVVIHGNGNYTGLQSVNFSIAVPKVTGVKASKYTASSITFSWTRNQLVKGYEIYNSKNKLQARVNKNSTVKATVKSLKAGTVSTFKIRAFVVKGGKYHYSDFVSIKAGTSTKAPSITSVKSKKSKRVTLKWKKIKGATTYQIYRSTSKKGKYKKIGSTTKLTYTDKKAKGGKTYYYKVRTGKKNNNKTYYSSYSKVKSVKAKK
ncbi:MAG: hypothetical protein HFI69_06345 [Lachnospiraceae bacterium]|nr:hypothetical protein [Lachnospiraceae bacterium]